MSYLDIRNNAVEQIRSALAGLEDIYVGTHPGIITETEAGAFVLQSPAVLTSLLKIYDSDTQDESSAEFASWVLCGAEGEGNSFDRAIEIVSAVIPVIRNLSAVWAYDGGINISAESLHSNITAGAGMTLWEVRWQWNLRGSIFNGERGGISLPDNPEDFAGYDAVHDIEELPAEDEVTF